MIASTVKLITLFICLTIITAFRSPNPRYVTRRVSSAPIATFMASPLEEVPEGEEATAEPMESSTVDDGNVVQNLGRGGEMKEVNWVDPAMSANTNPFDVSLLGYVLFLFPLLLLANDLFHFIPDSVKESPIGFMF